MDGRQRGECNEGEKEGRKELNGCGDEKRGVRKMNEKDSDERRAAFCVCAVCLCVSRGE